MGNQKRRNGSTSNCGCRTFRSGQVVLIAFAQERCPGIFGFSVSHTTRAPRGQEKNGVDYHFVSHDEFQAGLKAGDFIEYAEVHGNYYGTSKSSVDSVAKNGKICVLDIDVQGCRAVRSSELNPFTIFVMPPSMEALEQRLRARATDSEEVIQRRLANADEEIAAAREQGLFDVVIVNDDMKQAQADMLDCLADELAAFHGGGGQPAASTHGPADPTEGMTTAELLKGPKRAESKIRYQVRREHPLYTTSANVTGCNLDEGIPLPTKFYGVSGRFTQGFMSSDGCYWPNENQGLACHNDTSNVHRSHDYTTAYYLPGLKYGGAE